MKNGPKLLRAELTDAISSLKENDGGVAERTPRAQGLVGAPVTPQSDHMQAHCKEKKEINNHKLSKFDHF